MPDLVEVGAALGAFFAEPYRDLTPSHGQLDVAMDRFGLRGGDPVTAGTSVGKTRRVRDVLVWATDNAPDGGLNFVKHVVSLLRAADRFSPVAEVSTAPTVVDRLRQSLATIGYTLDSDGSLRLTVIDGLAGTELTDALRSHVNRLNLNPNDAALQIGESKDLTEAAARQVLLKHLGEYPVSGRPGSFPMTLGAAYASLGLAPAPTEWVIESDHDLLQAVHQALFHLAVSVNRLRNDAGTGHGKPDGPRKTAELSAADGRLVARAMALTTGFLLDALDESR